MDFATQIGLPPEPVDPHEGSAQVAEMPDGGAEVTFGEEEEEAQKPLPEFGDNLAEHLDEDDLDEIASDLTAKFDGDVTSNDEHRKLLVEGMRMLGVKLEDVDEPFEGACGAHHSLMLEAAVQFQARAIAELFPPGGPVKTKVVGVQTPEIVKQAERVREFLNYQLTEVMDEFFDELDQMLMALPILGSCFKKLYFDKTLGRPVSRYISPDYFVVAYGETDLRTCGRYTHIIPIDENQLRRQQVAGFYREVELDAPGPDQPGEVKVEGDKVDGRSPDTQSDETYRLLEIHVDYDMPGFEDDDGIKLPYIVTIEEGSKKVLSIRRNWRENDALKRRLQHFVHYKYLPSIGGFYGWGLIHLVGNTQKSLTSILRNLIDAGTFANLPAGFKTRGLRIAGDDEPLAFGEWRDVEGYGDDLRKSIIPLPYKEPSQTLFVLMGALTDNGRRLASIADINVGEGDENQAVGTTLALLEQGVKVMSAVHRRLHKAQKEELRLLARVNSDFLPDSYPYDVDGGPRTIKSQDFDSRVDVLPVSDPNIFSETQRIMRAQAMLQLATQFPQQHNLHEALYRMHDVIGTSRIDSVLNPEIGPKPMDPATENAAVLQSKAVRAYEWQDHAAHLAAHNAFMQDPSSGGNPMFAQIVGPLMLAHIAEHTAQQYRLQVIAASGIKLPPAPAYDPTNPGKNDDYMPMPPQVENAVAQRQAMAAQEIAKNAQIAAQAQKNQALMQDPSFQLALAQLNIEKAKAEGHVAAEGGKLAIKRRELAMKAIEMASRLKMEQEKLDAEVAMESARQDTQMAQTVLQTQTQERVAAKNRKAQSNGGK